MRNSIVSLYSQCIVQSHLKYKLSSGGTLDNSCCLTKQKFASINTAQNISPLEFQLHWLWLSTFTTNHIWPCSVSIMIDQISHHLFQRIHYSFCPKTYAPLASKLQMPPVHRKYLFQHISSQGYQTPEKVEKALILFNILYTLNLASSN